MNRNDFLNMMEESVPLNRQMIGEVYELIDIFPYFQSAHMLLLKGLQNSADVKFENQLRNSAIHIADREVLYYLLKRKTAENHINTVSVPETALFIDPHSDTEQTVIESGRNSKDLISEIEKSTGEILPEEEGSFTVPQPGHSVLIASEADNEEPAGVMVLLDEEPAVTDENVFFMDPGFSLPEHSDLLELDLDENLIGIGDEADDEQILLLPEEKNSGKLLQSDLIDKFITANPRIEPNRDKINLPIEDISTSFIEEEGGFVTETLARIYISQGYYSRAIDIFEKLSLKFPEKSSYFASQIEKVKEYIKK